jgi:hypothetical protein
MVGRKKLSGHIQRADGLYKICANPGIATARAMAPAQ